jgi:mannose-6-phosphate isomerase-like protein (cupin superfamily)
VLVHSISQTIARPPDWQQGGAEFWLLAKFNGGNSWIGRYSGTSPWEMHPDGDEFFHLLEGEVEITLLVEDAPERTMVSSGQTFVIPRGIWHRQHSSGQVIMLGATTGPTRHSMSENPAREA